MASQTFRKGGRVGLFIGAIAAFALCAEAAEPLFPTPLHLTRRIDDPLSGKPITVDEYCAGHRMVTVRGDQAVVIVDYDRQEMTEIDRAAGTYSISRFDEIARATPALRSTRQTAMRTQSLGSTGGVDGRTLEGYEVVSEGARLEARIDRSVRLQRAAVEVLLGTAYPSSSGPEQQALVAVAGEHLPAEQILTLELEGEKVIVRNVIIRVGDETVPLDLVAIPPSARRVESRFVTMNRMASELDRR